VQSHLGKARRRRRAAELAAVSALGLQALAVSRLLCTPEAFEPRFSVHCLCPPSAWPFLDYPMFKDVHRPGTELARWSVVARTREGREVLLRPEVPSERARADDAVAAMHAGDAKRALETFEGLSDVVRLELRREQLVLELDGFRVRSCETIFGEDVSGKEAP
jgi:hypothetical protein